MYYTKRSSDQSVRQIRIGRMKQKFGQRQTMIHRADRLKLLRLTVQKLRQLSGFQQPETQSGQQLPSPTKRTNNGEASRMHSGN